MTYLDHLTISTGHTQRSPRAEVADHSIDHTRELLADAIAAGGDIAMPVPGYQIHVEPFGDRRAMLATVSGLDGADLVTFGVAARPAKALWSQLVRLQAMIAPDVAIPPQPGAPWCAAVLLPALAADRAASGWLGDFERCVAWAWIER